MLQLNFGMALVVIFSELFEHGGTGNPGSLNDEHKMQVMLTWEAEALMGRDQGSLKGSFHKKAMS